MPHAVALVVHILINSVEKINCDYRDNSVQVCAYLYGAARFILWNRKPPVRSGRVPVYYIGIGALKFLLSGDW